MSTTFGVRIPSTDEVVEIARRVGVERFIIASANFSSVS